MIQKLAETDCLIIDLLNQEQPLSQYELSTKLHKSKSSISRRIYRLQKASLIITRRRGRIIECSLNRHKKNVIQEILAIWEKCNQSLFDKSKSLIRPHDFEIYVNAYVKPNYFRERFSCPHFPDNRVCRSRTIGGIGSIELSFNKSLEFKSSAQIFIEPFYLIVNIDIEKEELEALIINEIRKRYTFLKEELEKEGVIFSEDYEISSGALSLNDDYLAQIAIRNGLKIKNELDESNYGLPEFEAHEDCINAIYAILQLRRFCIKNKLSEYELSQLFLKGYQNIISKNKEL